MFHGLAASMNAALISRHHTGGIHTTTYEGKAHKVDTAIDRGKGPEGSGCLSFWTCAPSYAESRPRPERPPAIL